MHAESKASFRARSAVFAIAGSLLAWLLMMAVHELGHVVAAWGTGGRVERVALHPLAISRTDVQPNPRPLVVAWGGPLVGVALPLACWGVATAAGWRFSWTLRFFAGVCLLANGLYLGVGSFGGIGDAGDLLRHGAPRWSLWLFGLVTLPAGLLLWHGLGRHAGLGTDARPIDGRLAFGTLGVLLVVAAAFWFAFP